MVVSLVARVAMAAVVVLGCVRDDWTFPAPRDASTDGAAVDAPAPDAGLADAAKDSAPDVVPTCPDGPINLYRAEGSTIDSAGGQHAIASASVVYVEGRFGRAFSFRGPRDYVTIPASVGDFDGDFTIALWFKTTHAGEMLSRRAACWNGPPTTGEDMGISDEGTFASEMFTTGTGYFVLHGPAGFNDGAWHHVALVRRGEVLDLVLDGTTRATHAMTGGFFDPSRSPSYLGVSRCSRSAPGSNGTTDGRPWYDGALDEVAYYDRALSTDELVAQAQGLCAPGESIGAP